MKHFLSCLIVVCLMGLNAAEKIYLNPSASIGIFHQKNGAWHGAVSRLQLEYTSSHLTLDAVLTVPPGHTFKASGKDGDEMSVFGGEVFEFQIAPAGQKGIYYHFAISPSGYMYTARCRDTTWEPTVKVLESLVTGREWRFRLSVPFRDINATSPRPGEIWRMNFARRDVSSGPGIISSSHSGASDFHDLAQYSEVIFGRNSPSDTSILLQDVRLKHDLLQLDFTAQRKISAPLKLEFYAEGKLRCREDVVMQGDSVSKRIALPFGKLPLKAEIPSRIVLKNAKTGEVLCHSEGVIAISPDLLRLDWFYYVKSDPMIRFQYDLSGTVSVRLYDSAGKVVHTVPSGNSIPLSGLRPGRYVLEASNRRNSVSRVLFLLDQPPALGPLPSEYTLTIADRQLRSSGKPVFLLGLSSTPKSFPHFSDAFNLRYNNTAVRKNAVILGTLPGGKLIRKPFLGRIFPPDEKYLARLSAQVRKIRTKPIPSIWRISYEAQIPRAVKNNNGVLVPEDTAELMRKIYQTVKKANPKLLYSIQTDKPAKIKEFAPACDILETAFWSSSYAEAMMPNLMRDMLQAKNSAAPGQPVIFWLGGTIPNKTCRLAEEIRAAVYLSILHGFSGNIIHMGHGFLPQDRSRLWSLLSGIHAEIESFYADWAAGREIPAAFPEPFIGKAVRTASGERLMMVVNLSPAEKYFSCDLPGAPGKDLFTGFEPKIYRLPAK